MQQKVYLVIDRTGWEEKILGIYAKEEDATAMHAECENSVIEEHELIN